MFQVGAGALALGMATADAPPARMAQAGLSYVATAHQLGPVSFRDPLGALSPDGHWLGYSVQHHLFVVPATGGPVRELATEAGLILHLTWMPDSRRILVSHREDGAEPGRTGARWWTYDIAAGTHALSWPADRKLYSTTSGGGARGIAPDDLRQLTWSRDGSRLAGVWSGPAGSELWSFSADGGDVRVQSSPERLSFPAFAPPPDGHLACLSDDGKRQVVSDPCGMLRAPDAPEGYGPLAFSSVLDTLYYASPDSNGALDLWARSGRVGSPVRLTKFERDAYAPSVGPGGEILFKVQDYRTVVGVVPSSGGAVRPLARFQSETPSWDPTGEWIGITYGTWRRVADDFHYPDIAQDAGVIGADPDRPAERPARIVAASASEDQSLCWSPNGKWMAFHSHREQGDDIWLVPADGSGKERRLTWFGRGAETGWPRWSPDGKWLAFDAAPAGPAPRRSAIWVVGIDQESGAVTRPQRAVELAGYGGEPVHAEWLPGSSRLAVLTEEEPGRQAIVLVPRDGGTVRRVHRWASEHRFGGLGISPDGVWAAFVAPAPSGFFQLYRIPLRPRPRGASISPEQLTFDPSNKTQPAYSPDGTRIALTVWTYDMQFWILRP